MKHILEVEMKVLNDILDGIVKKIESYSLTGRELPAWLQKQKDGIYLMESDLHRGMALFTEGLRDEADHLEGLLNG